MTHTNAAACCAPVSRWHTQVSELLDRVSIFGCDDVSSRTAIVYIPNRIVISGSGGQPALKGRPLVHSEGICACSKPVPGVMLGVMSQAYI